MSRTPVCLYVPIWAIDLDGQTVNQLLEWYKGEPSKIRFRFGSHDEALRYWPDDYYQKLEIWWASEERVIEPLQVKTSDYPDIYLLIDGWHRLAISYKLEMTEVPIEIF